MKVKMFLLSILLVALYVSTLYAGTLLERTIELEAGFETYFMQGGVGESNTVYGNLEAEHSLLFTSTGDTLAFFEAKVDSIFSVMEPKQKKLMSMADTADATNLMIELTGIQLDYFNANVTATRYKLSRLKRIQSSRGNLAASYANITEALSQHNHWITNDGPVTFRDDLVNLLVDVRLSRSPTAKSECLQRIRTLRRRLVGYYSESAKRSGTESVVVEVMVGDEPCFLLVDTGSELVTLPSSIILALGWDGLPATEQVFTVAGGKKIHGLHVTFPEVSYKGFSVKNVEAGVLPSGNLGFDGLLGMSYLGRFTVEIDLQAETPLKLKNK